MTASPKPIHPFLVLIYSVYAWLAAVLLTIFFQLTGLLLILPLSLILDGDRRTLMHGVAMNWARSILALSPVWRLKVRGRKNFDRTKHYVIVANHQSLLDIITVLAGVPLHFKFMAKEELFSIPFIGWHMAAAGYIPLKRGDRESGRRAMEDAGRWISRGVSVLFFPEGTRSMDGEVKEFKAGAFKLAEECGVEILPVVLDGTWQAIPKKTWKLKQVSRFGVRILKPIAIGSEGVESVAKARDRVRLQIMEELKKMRQS